MAGTYFLPQLRQIMEDRNQEGTVDFEEADVGEA